MNPKKVATNSIAKPVVHAAREVTGSSLKPLAKFGNANYHEGMDDIHATVKGLCVADHYTVHEVKAAAEHYAIHPLERKLQNVVNPVVDFTAEGFQSASKHLAMGKSLIPGGKYVDQYLGSAAHALHVCRELGVALDLTRAVRRISAQAKDDVPPFIALAVRQTAEAVSLDPTAAAGATLAISSSAVNIISNSAIASVRPLAVLSTRQLLMEAPPVDPANQVCADPGFETAGEIVFVPGIDTPLALARRYALDLSARVHRPVKLIWNEDNGKVAGAFEGIYDRLFPYLQPGPFLALQGDQTVRHLSYTLNRSAKQNKRLIVVCFSQGTIQVRNATATLSALGDGAWCRDHLDVIAIGSPAINAEWQPCPHKLLEINDRYDAISQIVGLRVTDATTTHKWRGSPLASHNAENYINYLTPEMLED